MCCFRLLHKTISLQFGYKDSANRRQCKIKVPKLLFFLLRCSLSYQKIVQKIDLAKKKRMSLPKKGLL